MQDDEIMDLYLKREEAAISETEKKYGGYCHKVAENILHNKEDSEECVNDTWMKAWLAIPPARPTHLKLFLAKITRNLSFNRYKEKHAGKRGCGEMTEVLDELEECLYGSSDVETDYMAKELHDTINNFVRSLPERDRMVFIRRYFFVESISEIAKRHGLSESNVCVVLYRSRGKLKKQLEKEGYLL